MSNPIGWCEFTWNPFIGCDKVSPGCENCYAIRMAWRLAHIPATKHIYGESVKKTAGGKLNWTGKIIENTPQGDKPLRNKKPAMYFVNSMSDLFHDDMTFEMIDSVYDVMCAAHWHIFQVLTKRTKRMHDYYQWKAAGNGLNFEQWPLKNVWIGTSAEDQKRLDERYEWLLRSPASVRFLSCEPLLGSLNLAFAGTVPKDWGYGYRPIGSLIHWVIAGGESGAGARPMHPDWIREIRDQCKEDQIPLYFKQHGEFRAATGTDFITLDKSGKKTLIKSLKYQVMKDNGVMIRAGKHNTGNILDGKQYLEFPHPHGAIANQAK